MNAKATREYERQGLSRVEYNNIHKWLTSSYGKADSCESENCNYPNPKKFDWALRKEHLYNKDRDCFIQLCRSYHIKYDDSGNRGANGGYNKTSVINSDGQVFESMSKASRDCNISKTAIFYNIKGILKHAGGKTWKKVIN